MLGDRVKTCPPRVLGTAARTISGDVGTGSGNAEDVMSDGADSIDDAPESGHSGVEVLEVMSGPGTDSGLAATVYEVL